jgi:hypothetical protein
MGITDRGGVRGEQSNLVRFEAVAADGIAAAAAAVGGLMRLLPRLMRLS